MSWMGSFRKVDLERVAAAKGQGFYLGTKVEVLMLW